MQSTTARYGIPGQLVSDKGPQFASQEFAEFAKSNDIKKRLLLHITLVQVAKLNLLTKRLFISNFLRWRGAIQFLFSYRTTPNSTTGQTPAELFLNETRFDAP